MCVSVWLKVAMNRNALHFVLWQAIHLLTTSARLQRTHTLTSSVCFVYFVMAWAKSLLFKLLPDCNCLPTTHTFQFQFGSFLLFSASSSSVFRNFLAANFLRLSFHCLAVAYNSNWTFRTSAACHWPMLCWPTKRPKSVFGLTVSRVLIKLILYTDHSKPTTV